MAEIVGTVDGLALATQDRLVDQAVDGLLGNLLQHAVKIARAQPRTGGQRNAQRAQKLAQRFELGEVGLVVDAVEAGHVALLQRTGRPRHWPAP
jgi:hypothetical protein